MTTTVGPEGEITISKEIREQLGVQPGWQAVAMLVDGHLEVYFIPPEHDRSLLGSLKAYAKVPAPTEDELREWRENAWAEAAAEIDAAILAEWQARAGEMNSDGIMVRQELWSHGHNRAAWTETSRRARSLCSCRRRTYAP